MCAWYPDTQLPHHPAMLCENDEESFFREVFCESTKQLEQIDEEEEESSEAGTTESNMNENNTALGDNGINKNNNKSVTPSEKKSETKTSKKTSKKSSEKNSDKNSDKKGSKKKKNKKKSSDKKSGSHMKDLLLRKGRRFLDNLHDEFRMGPTSVGRKVTVPKTIAGAAKGSFHVKILKIVVRENGGRQFEFQDLQFTCAPCVPTKSPGHVNFYLTVNRVDDSLL